MAEEQEIRSILPANIHDQASASDSLGFEPYVKAIAGFLSNKYTAPPIVLSIEGPWGSGKTSFMLQLEETIRKNDPRALTFWFSAWRHDKEEAVWAAFALQFMESISAKLPRFERLQAFARLLSTRYNWRRGWVDLAHAVAISLTVLLALIFLAILAAHKGTDWALALVEQVPADGEKWDTWAGGAIAAGGLTSYFALAIFALKKIKAYVRNPFEINLKKFLHAPNYRERVSFIEQFHRDFHKIVDAYARDRIVYVFIDDLDRCEVPKAANLMKALNLMISEDIPLIFVIGMDREKIAAGLAVEHANLLPYVYSQWSPHGQRKELLGLDFGYNFIEKFVQLPFLIPQIREEGIQKFLAGIGGAREEGKPSWNWRIRRLLGPMSRVLRVRTRASGSLTTTTGRLTGGSADSLSTEDSSSGASRKEIEIRLQGDADTLEGILNHVAPALDYNPRRMKQFINLFRLRAFIAYETGLLDKTDKGNNLTFEQLSAFVAISLRWPLFLADLERDPKLLTKIVEELDPDDEERLPDDVQRWRREHLLVRLILPQDVDLQGLVSWSLVDADIEALLRISPRTRTIDIAKAMDENLGSAEDEGKTKEEDLQKPVPVSIESDFLTGIDHHWTTPPGRWEPELDSQRGLILLPHNEYLGELMSDERFHLKNVLILSDHTDLTEREIECEVELAPGALFNVIIRGEFTTGESYFARLDSRKEFRDCILVQPSEQRWHPVNETHKSVYSPHSKSLHMRIVAQGSQISLYRDEELIHQVTDIPDDPGRIVLFAEEKPVYVKSFKGRFATIGAL